MEFVTASTLLTTQFAHVDPYAKGTLKALQELDILRDDTKFRPIPANGCLRSGDIIEALVDPTDAEGLQACNSARRLALFSDVRRACGFPGDALFRVIFEERSRIEALIERLCQFGYCQECAQAAVDVTAAVLFADRASES